MGLVLETGPEVEPIDLESAKTYLGVDGSYRDAEILDLIAAARGYIERDTGRFLLTQAHTLILDRFPCVDDPSGGMIEMHFGPVQSVEIEYRDEGGVLRTLDPTSYQLDTSNPVARIACPDGWPSTREGLGAVSISAEVGYGDAASDVPPSLVQGVRLVLGHWFRNKEGVVTGVVSTAVHHALDAIIGSYRIP